MVESIRDRVDRLLRGTIDTHVDLLAMLLAETGLDPLEQVSRLDRLIRALQSHGFEATIFEDGRRIPATVDLTKNPPSLVLNEELLDRVGDDEILSALARPIALIIDIAPMTVAMALQIRDERFLKSLATKSNRRSETGGPVRANDLPAFVAYKISVFNARLSIVAAALGTFKKFELSAGEATYAALRGRSSWPDWADVLNLKCTADAVNGMQEALENTPWIEFAETVAELLWDSLALSGQTFLRHAGRELRGNNVPGLGNVLTSLMQAVRSQERTLTEDIATWPIYADVNQAWRNLDDEERRIFGVTTCEVDRPPASVITDAGVTFGMNEPASLPWDHPLVSWTVREQSALRDLFVGIATTLPQRTSTHAFSLSSLTREERRLSDGQGIAWALQVASDRTHVVHSDRESIARAYSSTLETLLAQYQALPLNHQDEAIRRIRRAYDDYFPESCEIWTRRFAGTSGSDFRTLLTGIQHMLNSPILFDPFLRPTMEELAPFPTLTVAVAREGDSTIIPFWVPIAALTSTTIGPPLRIRLATVTESGCAWECDRTLSLPKLEGQSVDLVLTAVHNDSLQFLLVQEP